MSAPANDTGQAPDEEPVASAVTITWFHPGEKVRGKLVRGTWEKLFQIFSTVPAPPPPKPIGEYARDLVAETREKTSRKRAKLGLDAPSDEDVVDEIRKMSLRGWSASTYAENYRKKENVQSIAALVLDYDEGQTTLAEAVAAWPGNTVFAVTSWSHTPAAPRFRVIIPFARALTTTEYEDQLWPWAETKLAALGQTIDPACKDASRLFFVPSRRTEDFSCLHQEGALLDVDQIVATVSDEFSLDDEDVQRANEARAFQEIPLSRRVALAGTAIRNHPDAVSGEGGHEALIKLAGVLVVGYALPEDTAFDLLKADYNPRCDPPWSDRDLLHKIKDAAKNPKGVPVGYKLPRKKAEDTSNVVECR